MNKEEAIAKVVKFRALASNNDNAAEAEAAKKRAEEICKTFGLTEDDFSGDRETAAFDELCDVLRKYVGQQRDIPPVVAETIMGLKSSPSAAEKRAALRKCVSGVRLAGLIPSFLIGDSMKQIKDIVERTLQKHRVII
jgi:hypothetical protein